MSKTKKCIFVSERVCPFQATQVPFQTCKICIEAWKTEVAIKKQQIQGRTPYAQKGEPESRRIFTPVIESNGSSVMDSKLKEIDELLKKDAIDPLEYIRLRKEQVEKLVHGKPKLGLDEVEVTKQEIIPPPRKIRVALIRKTLFGSKIITSPSDWKLPKSITGKIINTIYKMVKEKDASDIKLGVGDYKILGVSSVNNSIVLMVLDADEMFESYTAEAARIREVLKEENNWKKAIESLVK